LPKAPAAVGRLVLIASALVALITSSLLLSALFWKTMPAADPEFIFRLLLALTTSATAVFLLSVRVVFSGPGHRAVDLLRGVFLLGFLLLMLWQTIAGFGSKPPFEIALARYAPLIAAGSGIAIVLAYPVWDGRALMRHSFGRLAQGRWRSPGAAPKPFLVPKPVRLLMDAALRVARRPTLKWSVRTLAGSAFLNAGFLPLWLGVYVPIVLAVSIACGFLAYGHWLGAVLCSSLFLFPQRGVSPLEPGAPLGRRERFAAALTEIAVRTALAVALFAAAVALAALLVHHGAIPKSWPVVEPRATAWFVPIGVVPLCAVFGRLFQRVMAVGVLSGMLLVAGVFLGYRHIGRHLVNASDSPAVALAIAGLCAVSAVTCVLVLWRRYRFRSLC
jgi:hypothetical protein